jgi:uncharacterized protein DUF6922
VSAEPIPEDVARLLWDVDPAAVDLDRDRALIFERVMTRGTWDAMRWLRRRYPRDTIAAFLESEGARRLPPRDVAYWALVTGVEVPPTPGGARPKWAGV